MSKTDLYISVDIEADGPIPHQNSMLSIGCVAYLGDRKEVSSFYRTIEPRSGAKQDPRTMSEFWAKWPGCWREVNTNTIHPAVAMNDCKTWIRNLQGEIKLGLDEKTNPVFVAYPAGFDFMYVHWYMEKYVPPDPFGFSCLDIKTLAMAALGTPFGATWKGRMPKRWFAGIDPGIKHHALHDARAQGELFFRILDDLELIRSGLGEER